METEKANTNSIHCWSDEWVEWSATAREPLLYFLYFKKWSEITIIIKKIIIKNVLMKTSRRMLVSRNDNIVGRAHPCIINATKCLLTPGPRTVNISNESGKKRCTVANYYTRSNDTVKNIMHRKTTSNLV